MPHAVILIYDEEGNVIGQYDPGHEGEAGLSAFEPAKIVLDLGKIAERLNEKKHKD